MTGKSLDWPPEEYLPDSAGMAEGMTREASLPPGVLVPCPSKLQCVAADFQCVGARRVGACWPIKPCRLATCSNTWPSTTQFRPRSHRPAARFNAFQSSLRSRNTRAKGTSNPATELAIANKLTGHQTSTGATNSTNC